MTPIPVGGSFNATSKFPLTASFNVPNSTVTLYLKGVSYTIPFEEARAIIDGLSHSLNYFTQAAIDYENAQKDI